MYLCELSLAIGHTVDSFDNIRSFSLRSEAISVSRYVVAASAIDPRTTAAIVAITRASIA